MWDEGFFCRVRSLSRTKDTTENPLPPVGILSISPHHYPTAAITLPVPGRSVPPVAGFHPCHRAPAMCRENKTGRCGASACSTRFAQGSCTVPARGNAPPRRRGNLRRSADGDAGDEVFAAQLVAARATDDTDQQLDFDEAGKRVFVFDVAGEVCADAHRKEVQADDAGELQDAVAKKVTGERRHDEFVGEAATGDDEDGDDEGAVGFMCGSPG